MYWCPIVHVPNISTQLSDSGNYIMNDDNVSRAIALPHSEQLNKLLKKRWPMINKEPFIDQ